MKDIDYSIGTFILFTTAVQLAFFATLGWQLEVFAPGFHWRVIHIKGSGIILVLYLLVNALSVLVGLTAWRIAGKLKRKGE